ncbi:MAG: isoprenylcysteine carboxylmethyltransferase family protein [Candidatus Zixiibacteriota bacterium]
MIHFPGQDKLRAHLPDLESPLLRLLLALIGLASFAIATIIMIAVDHFFPMWTLLGQMGVLILAFLLESQFFRQKIRLKTRLGNMAYRYAFRAYILLSVAVILAVILHTAYLPGDRAVTGPYAKVISVIVVYLLLTGVIILARAVLTFGADNLALLYVYFPEEGRLVDSSIYALIRHPAYSAVLRIGVAIGLWHGTWFSIAFALFMPVGMTIWLKLVEEPELIERFGEGYADYRRKVPAFVPRLRDLGKFWRFLVCGK